MSIPTTSWDETAPAGSQSVSLGDDRIRELKTQLREIIEVDHIMSDSGQGATWGMHNKATFYNQGADPTAVADAFILFAKDSAGSKSELHFIDEDSNSVQLTSGGDFVGGMQYEVRLWSGLTANIPTGWLICDGTNDTPNLTDKFVRGTDSITVRPNGGTGGADSITLAEANLPSHTHTITVGNEAAHTHGIGVRINTVIQSNADSGVFYFAISSSTSPGTSDAGSTHTHTGSASSVGSGTSFDNMPAYVALAYIMKS